MKGKPSLAVVIGMGKPHGGDDSHEPDDDDMEDDHDDGAYEAAGAQIRHALKGGDDTALADAVCSLIDLHLARRDDGKGEDDDDEEPESERGERDGGY